MAKDRTWFEAMGVANPTSDAHITEDKLAELLHTPVKHQWKQEGARLVCSSCPFKHATAPSFMNHVLVGTDDNGNPIMEKIVAS